MRRDYKIKFTDKSKAKLWIQLDLAKVHCLKVLTTSSYIICYLHFLNLNNILTLPRTFAIAEAGFGLTRIVRLVFCLLDLHACMLVYKIKTNASCLETFSLEKMLNDFKNIHKNVMTHRVLEYIPSQKSKPRFNREKARFNQDEYNFNGINQYLSEILSSLTKKQTVSKPSKTEIL